MLEAERRTGSVLSGAGVSVGLLTGADASGVAGDGVALVSGVTGGSGAFAAWLVGAAVVVDGGTEVLTAGVTDEVTRNGREQSFRLRLTQTWVRASEGWRCLAGHASEPSSSSP